MQYQRKHFQESTKELLRTFKVSTRDRNFIRRIYRTNHAEDRFHDESRFRNQASDNNFLGQVLDVIEKGAEKILTLHNDKPGNYGVHSNSKGIGVIIDWRQDRLDRSDVKNNAYIVSILPVKPKHYFKNVEAGLITESFLRSFIVEERKSKGMSLKESQVIKSEGVIDHLIKEGIKVIFVDGSLYQHNFVDIITID